MQLTHFGHSCVLADFGHTTVLFDPGNFSHGFEGITGLSAIVITHQHPDHVDQERLPALLDGNPGAALYADPQTTEQLSVPCRAVHVGDELSVGELTIRAVGGHVIAQDESTAVIFGMPQEAIKTGVVDQVLPMESIYQGIEKRVLYIFGAAKVGAL